METSAKGDHQRPSPFDKLRMRVYFGISVASS